MVEIEEGLFIAAEHVIAVKKTSDTQCSVFFVGQSAVDGGFLVNKPALEAATDILEDIRETEEWKAALLTGSDEESDDDDDTSGEENEDEDAHAKPE